MVDCTQKSKSPTKNQHFSYIRLRIVVLCQARRIRVLYFFNFVHLSIISPFFLSIFFLTYFLFLRRESQTPLRKRRAVMAPNVKSVEKVGTVGKFGKMKGNSNFWEKTLFERSYSPVRKIGSFSTFDVYLTWDQLSSKKKKNRIRPLFGQNRQLGDGSDSGTSL